MPPIRALIVDDEPDICQLAEITLNRMNIDTLSAYNLQDARQLLQENEFNLCLTDMNLPDGNGIELVQHIQNEFPHIPVAVITAYGNVESAVSALKAGAFDFIAKPVDLSVLRRLVESSLKLSSPSANEQASAKTAIIGESDAIQALNKSIAKLARSQAPIFIHGESGTGKELAARQIHLQSSRADQPFVPVNCGAIPSELMESELFGHQKGSFTGATEDKQGLFLAANNGTLFLDEVAELPLHMQVKLLRALQEKSIKPVGAQQEIAIDVRILSASHQDLNALVDAGKFRQDLYYRINVIELDIPSLRQRRSDIPLLAEYFLQRIQSRMQLPPHTLEPSAIELLCQYNFPGNIRELENIIERALALADNQRISADDLNISPEINPAINPEINAAINPASQPGTQPQQSDIEPTASTNPPSLQDSERQAIKQALEQTRWNQAAAARLLGLSARQLRYRIKKLQIE
ncbi:MAG TPA: sigma-54 dependent transcriptional regulator [Gammaproteobacteria bacterium]